MYHIKLYNDSYTPISGMIRVDSDALPRPGDVIDYSDDSHDTFLVFDITHMLHNGKCLTLVSAREAAREDRYYNFTENGYLDTRDEHRHGELFVSQDGWSVVEECLPSFEEIPD